MFSQFNTSQGYGDDDMRENKPPSVELMRWEDDGLPSPPPREKKVESYDDFIKRRLKGDTQ